jgi:hypothetical protein
MEPQINAGELLLHLSQRLKLLELDEEKKSADAAEQQRELDSLMVLMEQQRELQELREWGHELTKAEEGAEAKKCAAAEEELKVKHKAEKVKAQRERDRREGEAMSAELKRQMANLFRSECMRWKKAHPEGVSNELGHDISFERFLAECFPVRKIMIAYCMHTFSHAIAPLGEHPMVINEYAAGRMDGHTLPRARVAGGFL